MYVKTGCPYCARAIAVADELDLTIEYKNKRDAGVLDELIARGGKSQYPYLVDSDRAVEMYESKDIIAYLREHYASVQA